MRTKKLQYITEPKEPNEGEGVYLLLTLTLTHSHTHTVNYPGPHVHTHPRDYKKEHFSYNLIGSLYQPIRFETEFFLLYTLK
jgi:hypothetical protein